MDCADVEALYAHMHAIEAHELLIALKAADYPYLKTEAKRKTHKELSKQVTANIIKPVGKHLTTEDLARMLNNG